MVIYLVRGHTGEFSDKREWTVAAYAEHTLATEHARLANLDAERWEKATNQEELWASHEADNEKCTCDHCWNGDLSLAPPDFSKYDPQLRVRYNGTDYTVEEVELCDALP